MFGFATGMFAAGGLIGIFTVRRGMVRTFLACLLIALFILGTALLGIFPLHFFDSIPAVAGAMILSAPPVAAGLLCGGATAWLLRRSGT